MARGASIEIVKSRIGFRSSRLMLACTPSLLALIAATPADAHSTKRAHHKAPQLALADAASSNTAPTAAAATAPTAPTATDAGVQPADPAGPAAPSTAAVRVPVAAVPGAGVRGPASVSGESPRSIASSGRPQSPPF